ncbi:hypothetical protein GCM10015535_05330 [Streptomyces gelaticus]|uniref:Uncharacterized protein n=1 Tax=Streptomyces gelaticus TaxID=285446 RepID=A0ABQ2VTK7_9ACTN|nr:hypothetical protein GCM10015535_05330 [Streptomyces gelaticus]
MTLVDDDSDPFDTHPVTTPRVPTTSSPHCEGIGGVLARRQAQLADGPDIARNTSGEDQGCASSGMLTSQRVSRRGRR